MSERERWIVYPLLFFALGAAIRDKLFHQVMTGELRAEEMRTEELRADKILCHQLALVDPNNPGRELAQLVPIERTDIVDGKEKRYSYGALRLIDSEQDEFFGVTNDYLRTRQIQCDGMRAENYVISSGVVIFDPLQPARQLANLGVFPKAPPGQPQPYRYGGLTLHDSKDSEIFGVANDQLRIRYVQCEGLQVVAPDDPSQVLFRLPAVSPGELPASE